MNTPKRPTSAGLYSDRFIPSRSATSDLHSAFELLTPPSGRTAVRGDGGAYGAMLRQHLLDDDQLPSTRPASAPAADSSKYSALDGLKRVTPGELTLTPSPRPRSGNLFRFSSAPRPASLPASSGSPSRGDLPALGPSAFGVDGRDALRMSHGANGRMRKIARAPYKVLDAPALKDDFYLNLVDWSSQNVMAVGLGSCVYLWSAHTSVVTKLCDLKFNGPVCSVAWSAAGTELAVGTSTGVVQVWDTVACKAIRTMTGHSQRVGCLAWSPSLLSSGGRDFDIYNRDLRAAPSFVARLRAHRQEVCGLKWSPDDAHLASGGNDNRLLVWSAAGLGCATGPDAHETPMLTFDAHEAAVKAIAWSPHARGLLASGGGTQDKKIRFWNTMTAAPLAAVDTGSQVCNLAWSKNVNELVSTHGYSQNQIIVWKYPSLTKVATLTGHSLRVLYLAVSPNGESIVTGAGDETLRFWNVFPGAKGKRGEGKSLSMLSPARMHIR